MNSNDFDIWLDRNAAELPKTIEPQRDLWPRIALAMDEAAVDTQQHGSRLWPFVAGIAATLVMTMLLSPLKEGRVSTVDAPGQVAATSSEGAGTASPEQLVLIQPQAAWVPEIRRTRNELDPDFRTGLEALPPDTREMVENNLRQIHESLAEIHEALAQDPGNLTLHRLLAGTYQQEIELISTIGAMTPSEQGL